MGKKGNIKKIETYAEATFDNYSVDSTVVKDFKEKLDGKYPAQSSDEITTTINLDEYLDKGSNNHTVFNVVESKSGKNKGKKGKYATYTTGFFDVKSDQLAKDIESSANTYPHNVGPGGSYYEVYPNDQGLSGKTPSESSSLNDASNLNIGPGGSYADIYPNESTKPNDAAKPSIGSNKIYGKRVNIR